MLLFFDTETTGLPLWNQPSEHPGQPHIVQLAAALCDDDCRIRAGFSLIVRPTGWTIPAETAAIHGITEEIANRCGVKEQTAVEMLVKLLGCAGTVIAHNLNFDRRIVRIALGRYVPGLCGSWDAFPGFCTMREATEHCRLPPTERMMAAGIRGYKSPNLAEAYEILCGKALPPGWHDALADMRACRAIYAKLAAGDAA